jgi:DNA-binding response OmpR family regulator
MEATVIREDANNILHLVVSDSGTGIPQNERDKIFDRFYRVEGSSEDVTGSGIGLALTRELAEALHGRIYVENRGDVCTGASFILDLPCGREAFEEDEIMQNNSAPVLSEELREKVQVIRNEMAAFTGNKDSELSEETMKPVILVVEDNLEMSGLIRKSFEDKYTVLEAENGKIAYELAKGRQIDLVISDIMMPVMNGTDLCNRLKDNIYTSHIPVILLSARTLVEHQLEGLKSGADDYVAKPFSMRLLKARAENLIESRRKLRALFAADGGEEAVSVNSVSSLDEKFITNAYSILEENFSDPGFCVERFAETMFMSRSLLYKKLKALTGLSPNDFITVFRLKKSLLNLRNGAVSVNEVAYKIGFNDPKYFSRVFKKYYKKTPSDYLCEIKKK